MADCISILRGYQYRAYPSQEQKDWLEREFGAVRFVYNHFLEVRRTHYQMTGKGLSYEDTTFMLTELKRDSRYEWLKAANAQALQQKLMDLERAFQNFYNRVALKKGGQWSDKVGYPKFKSKRGKQSFRVPQHFGIEGNAVKLPKLDIPLCFKLHRPLPEQAVVKSVTVLRVASGKYFVSFQVEQTIELPAAIDHEIGVDPGLTDFLVTSDGHKELHPKYLRKSRKKLRRLKRQHSRCKKGSANREKARRKLARQEERVANQRQDFLHRQSHRLVNENQVISVETLAVKNMMANHRLAHAIADSGWSTFVEQLRYKAKWRGRTVHKIDRWFPSTQL